MAHILGLSQYDKVFQFWYLQHRLHLLSYLLFFQRNRPMNYIFSERF